MFSLSTLYFKNAPRVISPLLMSSLPISILHRLFRIRIWSSWDVTASSPSFLALPLERSEKDASAKLFLSSTLHHLVTHTNYLFIYFYFPTFQCYNYNKNYKDFRRKCRRPKETTRLLQSGFSQLNCIKHKTFTG